MTTERSAVNTAMDTAAAVASGAISELHPTRQSLGRIAETHAGGHSLNAVIHTNPDASPIAMDAPALPLYGVPIVVKDNIATLSMPTSCGSNLLRGYVSPFEATAVRRLKAAGAVIVGKTNMDEFGMGSSTEFSAYGPTLNPLDNSRVPGGSSGGSAAAVAAGIVRIALGSETGGSVRQPAAFCGIVGIKPTYGRVSRCGLVAYASSLDQVGVFGATVKEAALALRVIAGADPLDATSSAMPVDAYDALPDAPPAGSTPLKGMVIGVPDEYFPEGLDPAIATCIRDAAEQFRVLGAQVRRVSLPHTSLAIPTYYIIAPAEASSNLSRFDGVRYGARVSAPDVQGLVRATRSSGFGVEVKRRILLGTYVLSAGYYDAYYLKAQEVRALISAEFDSCFATGVDLLLTPTAPVTAFPLGSTSDPFEMYLNDIFTVTANLAGLPAMSVPAGFVGGLPVGAQLIGRRFREVQMIRAAWAFEAIAGVKRAASGAK